ncbi:protein translocase SEC61 complex subunit gamma [Candidatus Woesearchaeota archaeon]|jgi:protein transport protein SEC61 subunit gamma-like protein|nr:protein translocase SEC61 complex subunit gamma [Candidatus Woesearchaeota archaeon]MBT4835435.1 protein translocase SEC61 complex subunit gamma [Candidatus Woesearchaeota archaeon]MBT6734873.1 protein translocase SEC61 complex subunit gamma [Candidatus Woesearchaeota archaeon]MBT7169612.1 protein translocase SEC61 complex subunit gamma [Candidatus Woesearchaeota archaeon]MBT7474570.1 protein translocase SEC61 complex subunit gamma [Candidatus Woesearchaeota archaeon]
MEHENRKRSIISKLKSFITQSKRVFKITKKPTNEELKITVKVTGIGILLIGAMGFLIHLVWRLLIG